MFFFVLLCRPLLYCAFIYTFYYIRLAMHLWPRSWFHLSDCCQLLLCTDWKHHKSSLFRDAATTISGSNSHTVYVKFCHAHSNMSSKCTRAFVCFVELQPLILMDIFWGAKHKSFFWWRKVLVKNELDTLRDSRKAVKNILLKKKEP